MVNWLQFVTTNAGDCSWSGTERVMPQHKAHQVAQGLTRSRMHEKLVRGILDGYVASDKGTCRCILTKAFTRACCDS